MVRQLSQLLLFICLNVVPRTCRVDCSEQSKGGVTLPKVASSSGDLGEGTAQTGLHNLTSLTNFMATVAAFHSGSV